MRSSRVSAIRDFILQHIRGDHLEADKDIFAAGYVNSLFAMQLVLFVEKEFGLSVDNEDLDINNFRTIDAINSFVERKLASTENS